MTPKFPDFPFSGRVALYPGSFNPFSVGHMSVLERALPLFDHIVIAIGVNPDKPEAADDALRRCEVIADLVKADPRVSVITYDCLTVDIARRVGARFILRGVRSAADFEYEQGLAAVNRDLAGIETVLLYSLPAHSPVSSSIVRELSRYGVNVSSYLPSPLPSPK